MCCPSIGGNPSPRCGGSSETGCLQGKLDPAALLAPIPEIQRRTAEVIEEGRGGGHIVNLGHGILPMVPVENARAFVQAVKSGSA
jgi:uroporphyrinogen decarboxylase